MSNVHSHKGLTARNLTKTKIILHCFKISAIQTLETENMPSGHPDALKNT